MKINRGISLIVLVITIIVVIILAGAVILSLSKNNPITSATEAAFKASASEYNSELLLATSKKYATSSTFNPSTFNATIWDGSANTTGTIKEYISSITIDDGKNYVISQGKIFYVGTETNKKTWAKDTGITDGLFVWLDGSDFTNSPQTTTWLDRSGNNNNATINGFGYTATSGSNGSGSVAFDGINDYALINGNFPSVLTIEVWGYANVSINKILWSFESKNYSYGPDLWSGWDTAVQLYLNIGDGSANPFSNSARPTINVWHHYVVVFDKNANLSTLYMDGVLIGTSAYRDSEGPKLYLGTIGKNNNDYNWNGLMKSIKVYNRILTNAEILQKYNSGM
jgi:Tfp pilus assembly protein PilE